MCRGEGVKEVRMDSLDCVLDWKERVGVCRTHRLRN